MLRSDTISAYFSKRGGPEPAPHSNMNKIHESHLRNADKPAAENIAIVFTVSGCLGHKKNPLFSFLHRGQYLWDVHFDLYLAVPDAAAHPKIIVRAYQIISLFRLLYVAGRRTIEGAGKNK